MSARRWRSVRRRATFRRRGGAPIQRAAGAPMKILEPGILAFLAQAFRMSRRGRA
jgi:hypothetical protein